MNERLKKVVKINIILCIVFIGYYFFAKKTNLYVPCIFYELTGYKCPGCGITHCLFEILKLNFKGAFYENPLVFIYLPFLIGYYFYMLYLYVYQKKDHILIKIPNGFKIGILVITIVYGIIRNIYHF